MPNCPYPAGLLLGLLLFGAASLSAQTPLDGNYRFAEGIYFDHEQLASQRPAYHWDELITRKYVSPEQALLVVEQMRHEHQSVDSLAERARYAVVDGLPYVAVPALRPARQAWIFVPLKVRGSICYYDYEQSEEVPVEMAAYNPQNGRPFRKATVMRKQTQRQRFLLDFATGKTYPFEAAQVSRLIAKDTQLSRSMQGLSAEEMDERLLKIILIYNDRHPVQMP